jgi:SAM-dependent methyltransferase
MSRLTGKENWDYLYAPAAVETDSRPASQGRLPQRFFGSYSADLFWSAVKKHVRENQPASPGRTVLEIGCAPGVIVREFAQRLDYIPHGVDFSQAGVDRTRENFSRWGYAPENVFHADIFDPAFQRSVAGKHDLVVSRGFAEHFTDLAEVVEAHLAPLRPGGLLVITIPNYRGLNYWVGSATLRELYPLHNFEIMNSQRFRAGFQAPNLQILQCGYLGGFDFGIFDTGGQTPWAKTCRRVQAGLNFLFRIIPPPETRWTSPNLVCIARKSTADSTQL